MCTPNLNWQNSLQLTKLLAPWAPLVPFSFCKHTHPTPNMISVISIFPVLTELFMALLRYRPWVPFCISLLPLSGAIKDISTALLALRGFL